MEINYFHIKCGARILNLIVHEGLKVIDDSLAKIRECMKSNFASCLEQLSHVTSKQVCQDVPTRRNSTYLMLERAIGFREAFTLLKNMDLYFDNCLLEEEWVEVEKLAKFLKPFYDITTLFSSSTYPAVNLYFYEKYWDSYSAILSFLVILDPRYKFQFVEYCYVKLYGSEEDVRLEKKLCASSRKELDLEAYLLEDKLDHKQYVDLDVLEKYLELSLMAQDVLSILITTVALESTFSISGRPNKYQSSLLPKNVEALVCLNDWLHGTPIALYLDDEELWKTFEPCLCLELLLIVMLFSHKFRIQFKRIESDTIIYC
ncbi:putative AC transposase [Glycine soja]